MRRSGRTPCANSRSSSSTSSRSCARSIGRRSPGTWWRSSSSSWPSFPACHPQRPLPGARLRDPRSPAAPLGAIGAHLLEGRHRTVIYLSAEYLIGPQLAANLLNLGIETEVRAALQSLGLSLDDLIAHEEEPGLGNGGLGRLAACFMDSLATLDSRPSVTACATSSASSIRRSATAGRSSAPTAGCAGATPGRSAATTSSTWSASAAIPSRSTDEPGRIPRVWHPGAGGHRRPLRHAGAGPRHHQHQFPAAVERGRRRGVRPRRLSGRRILARGRRPRSAARTSPRSSIPTTTVPPASSCGSSSSTSSSPARCRTASACCCRTASIEDLADRSARSSSTTPIRRSRWPS